MSKPGGLVLSTTAFSSPQQKSLLISFLHRLFPHLHFSAGIQKNNSLSFARPVRQDQPSERCVYNTETRFGRDNGCLRALVRQSSAEPVAAAVEQTDRQTDSTDVSVVCTSPQCDTVPLAKLTSHVPAACHPLLLHWKWQYNDHHEKTQISLLTWPKQSLKQEEQRKNSWAKPLKPAKNWTCDNLTPLRLREGTPKEHSHLRATQRHCIWYKENSKTHEALTCERNMLPLCQILLFIFY